MTPDSQKKNTIFVDGLELFHMHESRDHAMQLVEVAFFSENHTFTPLTPNMTFDPKLVIWHVLLQVLVIVTKFG